MNKAILIGNLTRDPEITTTQNGVSVTKFTLAVQRRFANADGEREADFINIVAWRTLAEHCHKYLKKGNKAAVVGYIQTRTYEANDGTKRYATDVVADEVEFLTPRNSDTGFYNESPKAQNDKEEIATLEPISDNDLPF